MQEFVIELNQLHLFKTGTDTKGVSLGTYSPFTVKLKKKFKPNLPIGHVTLFNEGDFYKTWRVFVAPDGSYFLLFADGDKDDKNLFDIYGEDVVGIPEKDFQRFINRFITEAQNFVHRQVEQL